MSRFWPLFISAVVFFVVLATGGAFINLAERRRSDEHRQALREMGTAQAHLLERQLDRSLSSTFALASILRQSGRIDNFDALAAEMIRSYGGISSLQLAPNGVVTQIYPLAGNEAAVGHDLLNDPERRTEALAAIESRKLTLAGPFRLIQGGVAVIGRLPVFIPDGAGSERFFGFTIALIHLRDLLEVSNLTRLVEDGYNYELSRTDPDSGTRAVFARSTPADLENTIPFEIEVPNGRWTLSVAPTGGWRYSSLLPLQIALAILASTLIAFLSYTILRQPEILRKEVMLRTQELADANRTLQFEITERKRVTKQIQRKIEEISTLRDLNLAISSTLNLQNVLNLVLEKSAQLLPNSGIYISLYNQDNGELEPIASLNFDTDELRESLRRRGGRSFAQIIFESKTLIVVKDLQTDPRVRDPEIARRRGLKSYIGMPLVVREEVLGVLGFHTKTEHDFSSGEVEVLSTLATQAAIAIHNSQLYTHIAEKTVELQKAYQHLSALYAVSNTVNESANIESMLQSVMQEVLKIFHFDAARVYLLDSQSNELRLNSYQGFPSEAVFPRRYRPGESVTGKVFAKGQPLFFEDLESDPEYQAMTLNSGALNLGFRSTFRFPIKFKEKTIGVFAFYCKSVHRFSTGEKEFIHSIVNHVGVAVERANLFEEINARVNELAALYSVSSTLSNSLETDLALRSGMQKVFEIFGFESARLYLFDEKEEELRLLANEGSPEGFVPSSSIKPGKGVLGKAFEEARLVYFEDIQADPNYLQLHPSGNALKAGFRGSLTIPIKAKNKVYGVMTFNSKAPHRFTAAEIQLIESIANNMSTVIENLNLFREVRSRSDELQKSHDELRDLAGRLLSAQEDERRRLARELHDDFAQRLAVLAIEAGKLEQQSSPFPDFVRERFTRMKEQIVNLSADIQRISRQLHPSILDDLGLVDAMESECRRFSELEGIPVKFTADRFPEGTPKDVSLCLYRVTQESLRNIAKHAKAREAHVTLTSMNGSVLLMVEDSGVGFDPAKTRGKPGLGLASMKERIRLINGSLSIHSAPGKGTVIEIQAPLAGKDRV